MNKPLCQVAMIKSGYQSRGGIESVPGGSHLLVQLKDFNNERTGIDFAGTVRFNPEAPVQLLMKGDVLLLAKGVRTFAYPVDWIPEAVAASANFFVIRPKPVLNALFLAWFLNQDGTKRTLSALSGSGTGMPSIRRSVLENLEIPIPKVGFQTAIGELARLARNEDALLSELGRKRQEMRDFYDQKILQLCNERGGLL